MGDYRRARCRRCGKHRSRVGTISWQGNCRKCGEIAMVENITGIHERKGEPWRRWRESMAASVGAVLLDAPRPSEQTGR